MDIELLREVLSTYQSLEQEKLDLSKLAFEERINILDILDRTFPWSYWYEYPYEKILALYICLAGMEDAVKKASESEDPQRYFIDYLATDPDPTGGQDYSDDEKSILTSLFFNIQHQLLSISMFSQTMSKLIRKAQNDDNALFDAILVDRSVLGVPSIARRIQYAQMIDDDSFMESLAKAVTRTRPRRPVEEYDSLRFMLEVAEEMKIVENSTREGLFDIFTHDLGLYNSESKNDPLSGFKRLLERINKRKAT